MATIAGLYIGLFGRPADPRGLAYFNAVTRNGADLSAIGPLENTAEFQARFGGRTTTEIIQSIHQSLFNRDASPQDLTLMAEAVSAGTQTINKLALAIIDGARGNDLAILTTKLAAATAFTAAVDTAAEISGYNGAAAANVASAFLASVGTTFPARTTIDNAVLRATGTGEIITLAAPPAGTLVSWPTYADVPVSMSDAQASEDPGITADYGLAQPDVGENLNDVALLTPTPSWPMRDLFVDTMWIA